MESQATEHLATEVTQRVSRRRRQRRCHRGRRQTTHNRSTEDLNDLVEPAIANEVEMVEAVSIPSIDINLDINSLLQSFQNNYHPNGRPINPQTTNTNNLTFTDVYNLFLTNKNILILRSFLNNTSSSLMTSLYVNSPLVLFSIKCLLMSWITVIISHLGQCIAIQWILFLNGLIHQCLKVINFIIIDGFQVTLISLSLTLPIILIFRKDQFFRFMINKITHIIVVFSIHFMSDFCLESSQLFCTHCSKKIHAITNGVIWGCSLVISASLIILFVGLIGESIFRRFMN